MLTLNELNILLPLVDAGIRASGLQVFQNEGGLHLHAALIKLQQMADAAKNQEVDNGEDHDQH